MRTVRLRAVVFPFALSAALIFFATVSLHAEVRLPGLFSDHALLQRDQPIHIWGWSSAGASIVVHLHQQSSHVLADENGAWSAFLNPESSGGPYTLTVSGDGIDVDVHDVLVGDLWLASGQSNMEFPLQGFGADTQLKNGGAEITAATHPNLRLLLVDHKSSDLPEQDVTAHWTLCTPETARHFSAVAYFFGREIASHEKVAVGLIDATWGGTPADSWVSMNTLGSNYNLLPAFASRAKFADQQVDVDGRITAEKRADEAAIAAGRPAPVHPWHPFAASWQPAGLYNGMIAPLTGLSIKGFLWYQGETNSSPERAPYYQDLFSALIGDWRMHFAQGNLPFLFAQISSSGGSPGEIWGAVRDQQRRTLDVANTAMAVTIDVGNATNVHPADKQTVGSRLALAARAIVYHEDVPYQGPLFRRVTSTTIGNQSALRVWFDHAEGLSTHGAPLAGFEVAGADRNYVAADARIEGTTVIVSSPEIPRPEFVRFAWSNIVKGNLYNADGLPTSTFTSDDARLEHYR